MMEDRLELESIERQIEYLFFKLDDIISRIREIESRLDSLERRLSHEG